MMSKVKGAIGRKRRWWQPYEREAISTHMVLNQDKLGLSADQLIRYKNNLDVYEKHEFQNLVNEIYSDKHLRIALIKYIANKNRQELSKNKDKNYKMISVVGKIKGIFDAQKEQLGYSQSSNSEFMMDLIESRTAIQTVMESRGISFEEALGHLSEIIDE